jgi:hypothetical protein
MSLLGLSCQLQLAWPANKKPSEPDYSEGIEALAAISISIDELIVRARQDGRSSIDQVKLAQAKDFVERAIELLLEDLRKRDNG